MAKPIGHRAIPGTFLSQTEFVAQCLEKAGGTADAAAVRSNPSAHSGRVVELCKEYRAAASLPEPKLITCQGRRQRGWRDVEIVWSSPGFDGVWIVGGASGGDRYYNLMPSPEQPPESTIEEEIDHVEEAISELATKRNKRDDAKRIERLAHEVSTLRERLAIIDDLSSREFVIQPFKGKHPAKREAVAVIAISDLHVEEPVTPESVNGLNIFDLSIADRDIESMAHSVRWLLNMHRARDSFKISRIIPWLGGDLLTGHIHEDLAETAQLSPVQTIAWLFERLARFLETLAEDPETEEVLVPCNIGNHGRTTKERRISTALDHSFEWLLYYMLAQRFLAHPKIKIKMPLGILTYTTIFDYTLRTTHGDSIGFGGGVGGISIPINKAIHQWNVARRADLTMLGHWHQYMSQEHFIVNGSGIGYNSFAISIKAGFEPPRQAFTLIDSTRGKCCSTPIWFPRRVIG